MSKIVGLDLGSVTCGVAVSDDLAFMAHPVKTIRYKENDIDHLLDQLEEVFEEYATQTVVLGLPRLLNGDYGPSAQRVLQFKKILEKLYELDIILVDERFSTLAAQRNLVAMDVSRKKRKKIIDQVAAVDILQSYLDRTKGEENGK